MVSETRIFCLTVLVLLVPAVAVAQAPPSTKTPVAPKTEQIDPKCAESGTQTTHRDRNDNYSGYNQSTDNIFHFAPPLTTRCTS
jgi:hypothetical protein